MRYSLTLVALFFTLFTYAQLPPTLGMGFQGYARKADGSAISNKTVRVKFSIYDRGGDQTVANSEFVEEHNVQTDAYGVFTAEVGSINTANYSGLNFTTKKYALNVQVAVDGGNFVTISDKYFNIVPYANAAGNGVPAGTIMPFGGNADKIPAGWVSCNGQSYSTTDPIYAKLFDAIGYNWGNNNGQFRVPQLEGVFLRGVGGSQGYDPNKNNRIVLDAYGRAGNVVGSYQRDELKSHNHGVNDPGHNHANGDFDRLTKFDGTGTTTATDNTWNTAEINLLVSNSIAHSGTNISIQNFGGTETRPINAAVLYIIKL